MSDQRADRDASAPDSSIHLIHARGLSGWDALVTLRREDVGAFDSSVNQLVPICHISL